MAHTRPRNELPDWEGQLSVSAQVARNELARFERAASELAGAEMPSVPPQRAIADSDADVPTQAYVARPRSSFPPRPATLPPLPSSPPPRVSQHPSTASPAAPASYRPPDPATMAPPRPFPFDPPTQSRGDFSPSSRPGRPLEWATRSGLSARYGAVPRSRLGLTIAATVVSLGVVVGFGLQWILNERDASSSGDGASPSTVSLASSTHPNSDLREFDADSSSTVPVDGATPRDADATLDARPQAWSLAVVSDQALVALAADGEDSALLQLELKSARDRTFADAIAVAAGREMQMRQEAEQLSERFMAMDPQQPDHFLIHDLMRLASDPYAYREAQLGFANHKSSLGPALLFRVTQSNRGAVADFAQMLLSTQPVYSRAGAALQLAIDAGNVTE
ncbi:MAG TPA: hypothetical protein VN764_13360, partial [Polyangiaceae bacterium]|nr:hypothetical protein [Polyangiaceae bacterium]